MKNFWKKYHKWVGLFFSFFILMFCFSGIVLNHRTLLAFNLAYFPLAVRMKNT